MRLFVDAPALHRVVVAATLRPNDRDIRNNVSGLGGMRRGDMIELPAPPDVSVVIAFERIRPRRRRATPS
jgi:hypothetical protein